LTHRPGKQYEPVDFEQVGAELAQKFDREFNRKEILSYVLYPQVFEQFEQHRITYDDVSVMDTPSFFYGMRPGEEILVEIEQGKTLLIKMISVGDLQVDGTRTVYFELNGQARQITIVDESAAGDVVTKEKADQTNPHHIGATMPGKVLKILVKPGAEVKKGHHMMVT
jgi:pyruvate carboxylase